MGIMKTMMVVAMMLASTPRVVGGDSSSLMNALILAGIEAMAIAGQCDSGGTGAWPEEGEHNPFLPPDFGAVSIGVSDD